MVASTGCRMEIAYIDPEVYSGIVNHKMRKDILRALYRMAEVGQEIPEQFYAMVAEILAYVYELSGKLQRRVAV